MLAILTVCLVGMVNLVHGQITDSKYFPCIERMDNSEVMLFIDHSKSNFTNNKSNSTNICTSELFNEGIQYYKSQGYNETDYFKFQDIQQITLTKENKTK
jgi:mevalonate pyrophosphate decarboxylase